jgi:hypothetical protein
MLPGLALAALVSTLPPAAPEARLAELDHRRVEMHLGVRGYGRFLDGQDELVPLDEDRGSAAYGGALQLGMGVRLVRGLYLSGEVGVGAHGAPFGAQGQVFLGLRHELRMLPWIRPSVSLGYAHLFDASFRAEADLPAPCGCGKDHDDGGFEFSGLAEASLASRSGIQGGLGLRMPMRFAPRLSFYVRGDVAYYFDALPGRLQAGGSLGLQVVF